MAGSRTGHSPQYVRRQKGGKYMGPELAHRSTTPTRPRTVYRVTDTAYMRLRRRKLGYSQRTLGAVLGMTHSGVHAIETGKVNASPEVAKAIAEALSEPLERLFELATTRSHRHHA